MASDPLPKDVSIRSTLLHDDAIHGLFPDLPTAAAALERAVSPINKEDLNFLHAIPIMSGWDNPTSWGLEAEQREKVLDIYREVKDAAQNVLMIRKKLVRLRLAVVDVEDKIHVRRAEDTDDFDEDEDEDEDENEDEEANIQSSQVRRARYTEMVDWEQEAKQKRQLENHLYAEVSSQDESLSNRAKECAAMLCPPFTACVRAAFPAELRNHIYDYLWDKDETDFVDGHISSSPLGKSDPRFSSPWVINVPFFADTHFADTQFALEAAAYFFRSASTAEVHYRFVRAFCEMSKFGNLSIRPINIIRRLSINIAWQIYQWQDFSYSEFRENMEYLLTLPVKDDFEIVIYLPRCMQFSRLLFHILETLRPIYKALVEKDMKMKVLGYDFFLDDEAEVGMAEQLNYYFDRTPEMWFAMKEVEINAIQRQDRKIASFGILKQMRHNLKDLGKLEEIGNMIGIAP